MPEAATGSVLWKKVFFKILQNLQETPVTEETLRNSAKFLRTSFLQKNSGRLLLKCGHCKSEVKEIDCLCCTEVDAILIVSAEILEYEGSISSSSFYGHLPDYQPNLLALNTGYMSSSCGSWCSWTKQGGLVNLRFYLFVSGVNYSEQEREVSSRFSFVTPGVWALPLRPTANEVA